MKKFVRALIILGLLGAVQNICPAENPYMSFHIPKRTLDIAKKAPDIKPQNDVPSSQVVRVGIGTEGFKSYIHKNTVIYATSEIILCDGDTAVQNFDSQINLNIKLNSLGEFEVSLDNGKIVGTYKGPLRFISPNGLIGIRGLKRAGVNALYHGAVEIVKAQNDFNVVNIIEVEDYLRGVVPNEMPVNFGLEALKAQSVAARNYVLSPRTKSSPNYDVVDSVASQVYYGVNTEKTLSDSAVKETEGIVAIYNWDLILAQYSSTAGGYSESYSNCFSDPFNKSFPSKSKPYLVAKPDIIGQESLNNDEKAFEFYSATPDSYDIRSPYYRWTREWTSDELKSVLQVNLPSQSATGFVKPEFNKGDILGNIQDIRVLKRGDSGKIIELEIYTDRGNYKVQKELVIRRLFTKLGKAMPSANMVFELTKNDETGKLENIKVYGGGYGHGVGMSQFGAGFMGKELNLPYYKILQHYYTGISLGTKPFTLSDKNNSVTQKFYWEGQKPVKIKIDNKHNVSDFTVVLNGEIKKLNLPTVFLGDRRFVEVDITEDLKKGGNEITFIWNGNEPANKNLNIYVELVAKDDNNGLW